MRVLADMGIPSSTVAYLDLEGTMRSMHETRGFSPWTMRRSFERPPLSVESTAEDLHYHCSRKNQG